MAYGPVMPLAFISARTGTGATARAFARADLPFGRLRVPSQSAPVGLPSPDMYDHRPETCPLLRCARLFRLAARRGHEARRRRQALRHRDPRRLLRLAAPRRPDRGRGAFDGIYVIRTSVPAAQMDAAQTVQAYKDLSRVRARLPFPQDRRSRKAHERTLRIVRPLIDLQHDFSCW
jgi:hypothetical protein